MQVRLRLRLKVQHDRKLVVRMRAAFISKTFKIVDSRMIGSWSCEYARHSHSGFSRLIGAAALDDRKPVVRMRTALHDLTHCNEVNGTGHLIITLQKGQRKPSASSGG